MIWLSAMSPSIMPGHSYFDGTKPAIPFCRAEHQLVLGLVAPLPCWGEGASHPKHSPTCLQWAAEHLTQEQILA